jgi:hypothetical protein
MWKENQITQSSNNTGPPGAQELLRLQRKVSGHYAIQPFQFREAEAGQPQRGVRILPRKIVIDRQNTRECNPHLHKSLWPSAMINLEASG